MALTKISTDGVKDDAVTAGKIPANAVGSSELSDNSVDTNAIQDQAVALSKLPHGDSNNNGKFLRANNGADPTFETVTGTTINNNADNRVITGSGTANTLEGEANCTFNGSQLDVTGTVRGNAFIGRSNISAPTADVSLYRAADNTLALGTASTERMRIDSSGNVGIGMTPSGMRLDLTATANDVARFSGANSGSMTFRNDTNHEMQIHTGASDALIFGTNGENERMRINSDGDVLIGRTSTIDTSEVLGIKGPSGDHCTFGITSDGNTGLGIIAFNDDDATFRGRIQYEHNGNIMSFHRNATEAFRIGDAENIFIHSQNSSGSNGRIYTNKSVNNTTLEINQNAGNGTEIITFRNSGTQLGTIHQSGSGVSYQSQSDYRLKENDVVISDGITRLKQLRPIRFNWKIDTETVVDGFYAHEVSAVVPEAVRGNKDEVFDTDGVGTQKKGDPKYQQLEQSKLVPLLTAALQEAITKIETLETKVAALEAA